MPSSSTHLKTRVSEVAPDARDPSSRNVSVSVNLYMVQNMPFFPRRRRGTGSRYYRPIADLLPINCKMKPDFQLRHLEYTELLAVFVDRVQLLFILTRFFENVDLIV